MSGYRLPFELFNEDERMRNERPHHEVDSSPRERSPDERGLRCAACGQLITNAAAAVMVNDAHAHVFANPHGFMYQIACFAAAPGVAVHPMESDDFAWFDGYRWAIVICVSCGRHMGWRFRSSGHRFFGLIRDNLIADERRLGDE